MVEGAVVVAGGVCWWVAVVAGGEEGVASDTGGAREGEEERAQRRSLALASWNMEVMLQPSTAHLVVDGPDLDAVEGVSSATLQAVAIEMRTIVRPSSQDNLVEGASATFVALRYLPRMCGPNGVPTAVQAKRFESTTPRPLR